MNVLMIFIFMIVTGVVMSILIFANILFSEINGLDYGLKKFVKGRNEKMRYISYGELDVVSELEWVERVEFNGISGYDKTSNWYTIYFNDGTEEDVFIKR